MTKEETIQIATLIQQVQDIKEDTAEIKEHLEKQGNKLEDAMHAIEVSRSIAKRADEKAVIVWTDSQTVLKELAKLEKRFLMLIAFMAGSGILTGVGFGISSLIGN